MKKKGKEVIKGKNLCASDGRYLCRRTPYAKFLILMALVLSTGLSFGQLSGIRTVCASGCDYATLTGAGGAFADVNTNGMNGNLILEIRGNLTEVGTNSLNQRTEVGGPFILTIKPQNTTMRTISGNVPGGMIRFSGADRVVIDGRNPLDATLNFTNRYLTFRNIANGPTISLTGDASDNSIRSAIIEGNSNSTTNGVLNFGGGIATGNFNITLEYCDVKDGSARPKNAIYSSGSTATISNRDITIQNNRIYNFFNASNTHGIFVSSNNNNWTIQNNSFYQTTTLNSAANTDVYGIEINNAGYHTIINNFLGGDSPDATITSNPWRFTNGSNYFRVRMIWVAGASTSTQTKISGNVITNITSSTSSGTVQNPLFVGIRMNNCLCTAESNFVGSKSDGTGSITVSDVSQGGVAVGILALGSTKVDIERNTVRNFTVSGLVAAPISAQFRGIDFNVTDTQFSSVFKNNVIANSLTSTANSAQRIFVGINIAALSQALIVRNQVGSVTNSALANNVTVNLAGAATSDIIGIANAGTALSTVNRNVIGNFNVAGTTTNPVLISAVSISNAVSGVTKNQIANFTSSLSSAEMYGVRVQAMTGNTEVSNNFVTFGSGIASDIRMYGLYNNVNNTNTIAFFSNSVVITGAGNAGNTRNTLALYRESNTPLNVKANLLLTNRTGGGSHYAIGTNNIANWATGTSDFNLLFSGTPGTLGLFPGSLDFAGWKAATIDDANSQNADVSLKFISIPNGDLRIPDDGSVEVDNFIIDKGTNVVIDDIDGAIRLSVVDIGASEVLLTWLGNSVDWFDPANWSGGIVPSCGGRNQVKIRSGVPFQPNVSAGSAAFLQLVINDGASFILSGTGSLDQCPAGTSPFGIVNTGTITVAGSQAITLKGNFTQNNIFVPGSGLVILNGNTPQFLNGDEVLNVNNLTVDGTGSKNVSQDINVNGTLTLTNGIINTSISSLLTFGTSASYLGGSATSFINGPAAKQTNNTSPFEFPIGKGASIRPLTVEPNNTTATTYVAEYFSASALTSIGAVTDGTLSNISDVEYWSLTRSSGSSDAFVSLTWDTRSGVSANAASPGRADLRVSYWDGSMWTNQGGNNIVGTQSSGSLKSNLISNFGFLTLGSEVPANPLPVSLLYFKAVAVGEVVRFNWATESEIKNDFFTVEVSSDGEKFSTVLKVKGNGTSKIKHFYDGVDQHPYLGISYYRLTQTDFDGKTKKYPIVKVEVNELSNGSMIAWPNPVVDEKFNIDLRRFAENTLVKLQLMDINGYTIIASEVFTDDKGSAMIEFLNITSKGLHILKASSHDSIAILKVLIH